MIRQDNYVNLIQGSSLCFVEVDNLMEEIKS